MRYFFLLLVYPLFAAYVGNPADPALMNSGFLSTTYPFCKFTSGYIYDYTSNMRFESKDQAIKSFGLHSQQGSFSLIFIERVQFFGRAGTSKETVQGQTLSEMVFEAHTAYHFSWATGAKVILWQWGQTFLSADFTYFAIPSSKKSFFKLLDQFTKATAGPEPFALRQWQVSGALSSRLYFITPYGGATYQNSHLHAQTNYHNQVHWGFFYGVTMSLSGKLHLNFERRVRDEFAYTFATTAVF